MYIALLLIDWLVFDFGLSERILDALLVDDGTMPPDSIFKLCHFVFNPLRIIGKPNDGMLMHFRIVKEIIFTFFYTLQLTIDMVTYFFNAAFLIK
jgi:hypothetical protein